MRCPTSRVIVGNSEGRRQFGEAGYPTGPSTGGRGLISVTNQTQDRQYRYPRCMMELSGRRRLTKIVWTTLVFSDVAARGQSPQAFEVAVIRPSTADTSTGTTFNVFEGGRLRITNDTVKLLIRAAFQIQRYQIVGAPPWVDADRYDVEARTERPGKPGPDQLSPPLQSLLRDRFNLKFHWETRVLTAYALVVGKNQKGGSKLMVKAEDEGSSFSVHGGSGKSQLIGTGVSMGTLANQLGNRLGTVVVDRTGLLGSYDLNLEWAPDETSDSSAPSLVTALREELGLRLEPTKSPVKVLVIDSIQKPAEN
jgi:uncharacterized protein (TIGR03435 family)